MENYFNQAAVAPVLKTFCGRLGRVVRDYTMKNKSSPYLGRLKARDLRVLWNEPSGLISHLQPSITFINAPSTPFQMLQTLDSPQDDWC